MKITVALIERMADLTEEKLYRFLVDHEASIDYVTLAARIKEMLTSASGDQVLIGKLESLQEIIILFEARQRLSGAVSDIQVKPNPNPLIERGA